MPTAAADAAVPAQAEAMAEEVAELPKTCTTCRQGIPKDAKCTAIFTPGQGKSARTYWRCQKCVALKARLRRAVEPDDKDDFKGNFGEERQEFMRRAADLYGQQLKMFVSQTMEKIRTTTKSASYEGEAYWHTEDEIDKKFKPDVVAHIKANARKLPNASTGEMEWEVFRYKTKTADATKDEEILKRKAETEETQKAPKKQKVEKPTKEEDGGAPDDSKNALNEKQLQRVQKAYDKIWATVGELDVLYKKCREPDMAEYVQAKHMKTAEQTLAAIIIVRDSLNTAIQAKRAPEADFLKKLAGAQKAAVDLAKTSTLKLNSFQADAEEDQEEEADPDAEEQQYEEADPDAEEQQEA